MHLYAASIRQEDLGWEATCPEVPGAAAWSHTPELATECLRWAIAETNDEPLEDVALRIA